MLASASVTRRFWMELGLGKRLSRGLAPSGGSLCVRPIRQGQSDRYGRSAVACVQSRGGFIGWIGPPTVSLKSGGGRGTIARPSFDRIDSVLQTRRRGQISRRRPSLMRGLP